MLSYIYSVRGYLNVFSILILFHYLVAIRVNVRQEKIIMSNICRGFVCSFVCLFCGSMCSLFLGSLGIVKLNNKLQAV